MKASDFSIVKVIGRGAFGEVQLVCYCRLWSCACHYFVYRWMQTNDPAKGLENLTMPVKMTSLT